MHPEPVRAYHGFQSMKQLWALSPPWNHEMLVHHYPSEFCQGALANSFQLIHLYSWVEKPWHLSVLQVLAQNMMQYPWPVPKPDHQPSTIPIMSHLHLPQTYKYATTARRKINKQGPISRRLEESRTCISKLSWKWPHLPWPKPFQFYCKVINSTYKKVLKESFLVLDVKNCVSAINDIKRFWFVVCSCYVSNNKFNLYRK